MAGLSTETMRTGGRTGGRGGRRVARNGRIEWRTLALFAACYGLWIAGLAGFAALEGWVAVLCLVPVMVAATFHTSLQHEVIHGHPTPWRWLNEAMVSLPLAIVFPYRRYRALHLAHHFDANLTDPYEDPESFYWPAEHYRRMRPLLRATLEFNNTLVGRLLVGPFLSIYGFLRTEATRLVRREAEVARAWALHLPGVVAVLALAAWIGAGPLTYLALVYPALSLALLRSFAEHQAAEAIGARSAVVETGWPLALLFLNNNLHIVHHAHPGVPWYDLPRLYRERRDHFLRVNGNYRFKGYGEIVRRFAFRTRQPVPHPYSGVDGQVGGQVSGQAAG